MRPGGDQHFARQVDPPEQRLAGDAIEGVVAAEVLGEQQQRLAIAHRRGMDAAVAAIVVGPLSEFPHQGEDLLGAEAGGAGARPRFGMGKFEGDAGAAAGGQGRLEALGNLAANPYPGLPLFGADAESLQVVQTVNEALQPQKAGHQKIEPVRRSNQSGQFAAVDLEGEGRFLHHVALDGFELSFGIAVDLPCG